MSDFLLYSNEDRELTDIQELLRTRKSTLRPSTDLRGFPRDQNGYLWHLAARDHD